MIYIVLREPTTSGGYVNRFAFSDQRTTLAIDCGGASVSPAARITSMSEMANKLDISQAKGGLGQGIEWSASLADWDGVARTSASIFDGSARFYGWSVAVARSDSETATPDWIFDVDHWMVTDVSADGCTISITVGERWASDGRLLAFGRDGATVPLVVGGHDVWVPTASFAVKKITRAATSPGWSIADITAPAVEIQEPKVFATSKSGSSYFFDCGASGAAYAFLASLPAGVRINGSSSSEQPASLSVSGNSVVAGVSSTFYAAESAESVYFSESSTAPICVGAIAVDGFSADGALRSPFGTCAVINDAISFTPLVQYQDGSFLCRNMLETTLAWRERVTEGYYIAYNGPPEVLRHGEALQAFQAPNSPGDWTITDPQWMTFGTAGGGTQLGIDIRPFLDFGDTSVFDSFLIDFSAKLFFYRDPSSSGDSGAVGSVWVYYPASKSTLTDTKPNGSSELLIDLRPSALSSVPSMYLFASLDEIAANSWFKVNVTYPGDTQIMAEIQNFTLYGDSKVSFGSTYAFVRTAAFPFPYAGYATNDRLDRAAITLIEQLAPYHGVTILPAAPTFLPTAAQGGECLDASKTYRDNAVALLEETWQVLGVTAYGATPTDGQGLGEIPTPVSIVLGRFEDIVTEPVIEFCPVAGTLTKKAYIANVDLEFDSTNPGKFYGGWGPSVQPDSLVIDGITWTITHFPPPQAGSGNWYQATLSDGLLHFQWVPFVNYGYEIWRMCRAAWKVHHIKRGATYQFNGIYDEAVVGQMWWESRRNGSRRIEWLCLQPRYLTYSVREAKPLAWSGSAVYIAGTLANYAGYDVSTWDNAGGDTLVVVDRTYDLLTGVGKYTVAIPPVPTVDAVAIYRDTLDAAHTIDRLVDTIDATAVTTKYTDTLEA